MLRDSLLVGGTIEGGVGGDTPSISSTRSGRGAGRNTRMHTSFIWFFFLGQDFHVDVSDLWPKAFWHACRSKKNMAYECQCLTSYFNPCSVFLPLDGGQEERGLAQVSWQWVAEQRMNQKSPALCPELPYYITQFLYTRQQFPGRWKLCLTETVQTETSAHRADPVSNCSEPQVHQAQICLQLLGRQLSYLWTLLLIPVRGNQLKKMEIIPGRWRRWW